jgi:hypothetical protein
MSLIGDHLHIPIKLKVSKVVDGSSSSRLSIKLCRKYSSEDLDVVLLDVV